MRSFAVALMLVLFQATAADAVSCQQWNRMDPGQKAGTIDRMIGNAVRSNAAKRYDVNVADIGRCLDVSATDMQRDFDDACGDSRTAGMQAIRGIFKNYIWSCVN